MGQQLTPIRAGLLQISRCNQLTVQRQRRQRGLNQTQPLLQRGVDLKTLTKLLLELPSRFKRKDPTT